MRLLSIALPESTRNGRVAMLLVQILGATMALPACMGGQTGTEYSPDPAGGAASQSNDGTNGSVGRGDDSKGTSGETSSESSGGATVGVPTGSSGGVATPATPSLDLKPPCESVTSTDSGLPGSIGLSASTVESFVMRAEPLAIKGFPDGASVAHIKLAAKSASGCFTPAGSQPASLLLPVDVALSTDDARLSLSMAGTATAQAAAGGGLSVVELGVSIQCDAASGGSGLAPCMVGGIDLTMYQRIRVDLSARIQSTAGLIGVLGVLSVSGSNEPTCPREPCPPANWTQIAAFALEN